MVLAYGWYKVVMEGGSINNVLNTIITRLRWRGVEATVGQVTLPSSSFITGDSAVNNEQLTVLFKYPGKADEKWWRELLGEDSPYKDNKYQSFLHDGLMAAHFAWKEGGDEALEVYVVKTNLGTLDSLEKVGFSVLPDTARSSGRRDQFCIAGGVIRTRLYPDNEKRHSTQLPVVFADGQRRDLLFCDSRSEYVDLCWQSKYAGMVNYKQLAGTQLCVQSEYLQRDTWHLCTLKLHGKGA